MSGLTHLRLAALCAIAYAVLAVSGLVHYFQRTGSLRALLRGLMHPQLWVVLLVALLVTIGLFSRRAWAWWLGIAAACYGVFRIGSAWFHSGARLPHAPALIALVLLVVMLLLLAPRSARLAANR